MIPVPVDKATNHPALVLEAVLHSKKAPLVCNLEFSFRV